MALSELHKVTAPTLLLVGGLDSQVIALNKKAYERMQCERQLQIIPGASHRFGEPGKLEAVAAYTAGWLEQWI